MSQGLDRHPNSRESKANLGPFKLGPVVGVTCLFPCHPRLFCCVLPQICVWFPVCLFVLFRSSLDQVPLNWWFGFEPWFLAGVNENLPKPPNQTTNPNHQSPTHPPTHPPIHPTHTLTTHPRQICLFALSGLLVSRSCFCLHGPSRLNMLLHAHLNSVWPLNVHFVQRKVAFLLKEFHRATHTGH